MNSFFNTFLGKLAFQVVRPLELLQQRWMAELHRQYGTSPCDLEVYADSEFRREVMFEHIQREGFHPYEFVWRKRKMARYEKMAFALWGCKVPESVARENSQYTQQQAHHLGLEYRRYVFQNYTSDRTHYLTFFSTLRLFPLEWVIIRGIFNPATWDRYFFNEVNRNSPAMTAQDFENLATKPFGMDLKTPEGRASFEALVRDVEKVSPGSFAPAGQQPNFTDIYASRGLPASTAPARP
jgi:hypothetical protein